MLGVSHPKWILLMHGNLKKHRSYWGKIKSLLKGGKKRAHTEKRIHALENQLKAVKKEFNRRCPGDDLTRTTGWKPITAGPPPFIIGKRERIRVLFLNSMGGSMARLSKALLSYEDIDADCVIGAYSPRSHLFYPHETNAHGVLTHEEWRDYLAWAVQNYDIVQSTTLPLAGEVAACYDWLTETLGRRHIWRETGFVHHYLLREDVLPLHYYQDDLKTKNVPDPSRFQGKTFPVVENHFQTDPQVLFYSSPEKGAYFQGSDIHWLPSIREPDVFHPGREAASPPDGRPIRVYVPYHKKAMWKGLETVLDVLEEIRREGANLQVVTADNAREIFPDLVEIGNSAETAKPARAYPVPNYHMPELFRRVDFVVDQIVMGSYGNTGIEAMFTGKPVIGQKRYAELEEAPIWPVEADNLKTRILEFLERRDEWARFGQEGLEYAMRVHSPRAVAKIAADVYRRVLNE